MGEDFFGLEYYYRLESDKKERTPNGKEEYRIKFRSAGRFSGRTIRELPEVVRL